MDIDDKRYVTYIKNLSILHYLAKRNNKEINFGWCEWVEKDSVGICFICNKTFSDKDGAWWMLHGYDHLKPYLVFT